MFRLLFCFLILLTFKSPAQELFFSQPSNFQNLPSQETYSVFQDSKGFIWITTDAGICRYDGSQLTVFTVNEGITENVVFNVQEDDKGRVWFSTLSGSLFYFSEGKFTSIAANEELRKICRTMTINGFFFGKKDTLFLSAGGSSISGVRGIVKIPPENNYRNIIIDSLHFSLCQRFFITNPKHPTQVIVGSGCVYEENDSSKLIIQYEKKIVRFPAKGSWYNSNRWKGAADKYGNIYVLFGKELIIISKAGIIKNRYLFDCDINSCYVDPEDDLWVCTIKGGYLFKNADLKNSPISFLNNVSLSSVLVDREGTTWIATLEKGVLRSINKNILFLNEQEDKPIYLQKDSNQLNITYESKKIISLFKNDSLFEEEGLKNTSLTGSRIACSYNDQNLIYLQYDNHFLIWDIKKKNFILDYPKKINISNILKIGKDSFLLTSSPCILTYYNKVGNALMTPFPVREVLQLKNKKIILSSRNNSGMYEFVNNTFVPYLPNQPKLKTRINYMVEDAHGNIWLATNENGLYCYDYNHQLHQYTRINGLVSDKINTLAIDDQHNLWLGSYSGLTKFSYSKDLKNIQVVNFDKSHGLPTLQIERMMTFNGKIICMGKDITFYFKENELKKNTIPPLNYIQSVSINDKAYTPTDIVFLSYDQNNLHIFTSLLTYKNVAQRKFLYKLTGYDKEWHASTTGDIQYTNLPHGSYTILIHGLNNDNIKSSKPATFTFTINRPFWLTWWFIALEIILFCIIFFFVFRFWKNRLQKKEHDKARINQKMAEFKMTALRSQMNPHFIFNAIGSIQHYILKNEIKQSYNYLSKFSMLIRNILNNSREEYISLSQEINTLRLYIELEQIRFTNPFKFVIEVDEQLDMDMDIPTMLIQPYVENSIWHGLMPKESDGILELFFKKRDDTLFVAIRDNGIGRKIKDLSQKSHISKGMSITEQRIQTLEATNQKKFITNIIDLKDEDNNSVGTEVQLIIPLNI